MAAIDPWEKAADCERAAQATLDPLRRNILLKLQSLWVTLANESGVMTPPSWRARPNGLVACRPIWFRPTFR